MIDPIPGRARFYNHAGALRAVRQAAERLNVKESTILPLQRFPTLGGFPRHAMASELVAKYRRIHQVAG